MATTPDINDYGLVCPSCGSAKLTWSKHQADCGECSAKFPVIAGVPWLHANPTDTLWHWRGQVRHYLQHLEREADDIKASLKDSNLPPLTDKRLQMLLQARVEHRKAVAKEMAPLDAPDVGSLAMSQAMGTPLPNGAGLNSYYDNLFRDWAWPDSTENRESCELVASLVEQSPKRVLVLGAGAGRLAFDLHHHWQAEQTLAIDINPLLVLTAQKLYQGRNVTLYEFPIAPRDLQSCAIKRKLSAPQAAAPGLQLLFADGLHPPVAAGHYDVVITPWFVDIVPEDPYQWLPRLNRIMTQDQVWLNFGALSFNRSSVQRQYSKEELLAQVEAAGFSIGDTTSQSLPYMQSPASNHGRLERVFAFNAKKSRDSDGLSKEPAGKSWLEQTDQAIPLSPQTQQQAIVHKIYAQVLGLVDGKRSIDEIAAVMAKDHGMSLEDARVSLQNFFAR